MRSYELRATSYVVDSFPNSQLAACSSQLLASPMKRPLRAPATQAGGTLLARTPRLGRQGGLELTARRVLDGLYAGRHRSAWHGSSIDFAEHRPYQPGDEPRTIDWRAFARTDRLLIRRYHDERHLPLTLVFDTSASMGYGTPTKHATAVLAGAALALLAIDQGDSVRVLAGATGLAGTGDLGGGHGASRVLQVLDDLTVSGATGLPAALERLSATLNRRSLVVVFSDLLLDPALLSAPLGLLQARGHEVTLLQVLDPSEVALPATWGRVTLTDPEGVEQPFSCDAATAAADYQRAMAAHLEHCRTVCTMVGVDHLLLTTDQPVAQVLGEWLARRRRR